MLDKNEQELEKDELRNKDIRLEWINNKSCPYHSESK